MKNRFRFQGFLAGFLTAALLLTAGGAALASRTVQIDDGIAVTVNGVPFTPRDANGRTVPLFALEGTTYAPVRALAGAAGLLVDYDAATRTARLETPDYAAASDPNSAGYIGAEKAKAIALRDAGVSADAARILKACLDWEDGRAVYEVEFCAQRSEYDYDIDALTGTVLERSYDCDSFDWAHHDDYRISLGLDRQGHHSEPHGQGQPSAADVISADRARAIALERLPGATVRKCELDFDDGRWEYELELRLGGAEYECELDAKTGEILKWERD